VKFGAAFPSHGKAFEVVKQGEGLLHDVAEFAQALEVRCSSAGGNRQDPALARFEAVGLGVVALVAEQGVGATAWFAGTACDGRDAVDEGKGLGAGCGRGRSSWPGP
jgi:hypothetical protein